MAQAELELIGTEVCPFAHRNVILMLEKGVSFKQTFIDSRNKPDWFLELNPLGKVPILRHGDAALFDSGAINEYLDEVFGEPLHPKDPVLKCYNRGWIEFGSTIFVESYKHLCAKDEEGSLAAQQEIINKLKAVEQYLGEGPWFNGQNYSLVDVSFAPFFARAIMLSIPACGVDLFAETPKVAAWGQRLVERQAVKDSLPDDYVELAAKRYAERGGWLAGKYVSEQLSKAS